MRRSIEWILTGALLAGLAAAAIASETVKYTYDAKGRLVRVEHFGNVNNGVVIRGDTREHTGYLQPDRYP